MKISVILCTLNPRKDYLDRTLSALRGQTLPANQWEFLLIDNCSTIPLAETVDLSWHSNARHIREDKPGKMAAWQRGMREANGELFVFVDDDNVLKENYLEQVLAVASEWPFIGAWGASVVPEFATPVPDWCKNHMWRLSIEKVETDVWSNLREGFETKPLGAGMCVRPEVAARYLEWCRINQASHTLDRTGITGAITGYGDMDLAHCAIDIGLGTGKSSRLHLDHLIPSSRLTLDYFLRHAEGDGASLMMFRAIRGLPISKPKTSFLKRLKRRLYWLLTRTGSEEIQIAQAHERGINKGWQMAQEYLQAKARIS